jgi:predicted amidohydrolase YtcJ
MACLWHVACAADVESADSIYTHGRIYTVNDSQPWAEAMAVKDGKIVFVGSDADVRRYSGKSTHNIDMHGHMVMPGIHDSHGHMMSAGAQLAFGCTLPKGPFGDDDRLLIAKLKECEQRLQPGQPLMARPFLSEQFAGSKPDRRNIDVAFPDRPVYLVEYTGHNGLANGKLLEAAGIHANDADPAGGQYVRDAQGRLTGEMIEKANTIVRSKISVRSAAQSLAAVRKAVATYNEYGVTSAQESASTRPLLEALQTLEGANQLSVNVWAHLVWHREFDGSVEAENEALIRERRRYASRHVNVDNIKIFIDGTPTAPYFTAANFDEVTQTPDMRHILVPLDELNEGLRRFDSMGMRVKMHASGAGAAHVAIDAIEYARKANPGSMVRHEVAHTNLIRIQDMDRMKPLNITAELSPSVWDTYGEYLGNPPQKAWQFKTLSGKGMLMTIGTDWGVTALPNLFPAIQGTLEHGAESIDLPLTLRLLTLNGAIADGRERDLGSLEAGKAANFIVLDQRLFEIPVKQIGATHVLTTVFEGRVVYQRPSDAEPEHRTSARTR